MQLLPFQKMNRRFLCPKKKLGSAFPVLGRILARRFLCPEKHRFGISYVETNSGSKFSMCLHVGRVFRRLRIPLQRFCVFGLSLIGVSYAQNIIIPANPEKKKKPSAFLIFKASADHFFDFFLFFQNGFFRFRKNDFFLFFFCFCLFWK